MDTYRIRTATPADLIKMLDNERTAVSVPLQEDTLTKLLKDKNRISVVAAFGGFVMGHAIYGRSGRYLTVDRFVVGKEWQRDGVGSALMAKVRDDFHKSGAEMISVLVEEENLVGQLFLRASGFRGKLVEVLNDADLIEFTLSRQPERPAYVNRIASIMG